MQGGFADRRGPQRDHTDPEEQGRTLEDLQVETRALREALDRSARHAHDVDPSRSHGAVFDECSHPMCRQARALLPEGSDRPRASTPPPLEPPALGIEALGGGPEPAARSGDDDQEPSWIPLERPPTPPLRRPAPKEPEAASVAERSEPDEPVRPEPPVQPDPPVPPPVQPKPPEPPIRPEPPLEPPAAKPVEPPAAAAGGGPLTPEPGPPSWGPPAIDLPPEAAFAEDEAMSDEPAPAADTRPDEPSIPSHLFDSPSARETTPASEPGGADRPIEHPHPRHAPGPRDPNIADTAADAIDRLARALFGPKRPRH